MLRSRATWGVRGWLAGGVSLVMVVPALAGEGDWTVSGTAGLKLGLDTNVHLQDAHAPLLASAPLAGGNVARADVDSGFATAALSAAASRAFGGGRTEFSYGVEQTVYEALPGEDSTTHKAGVVSTGKAGETAWEARLSGVLVDGSSENLQFVRRGGAPAAGGPALRDRRDQRLARGSVRFTVPLAGEWSVRPGVSLYAHDFQTRARAASGAYAGYQNYADRGEWLVGADLGRTARGVYWFAGGRAGAQWQERLGLPGLDTSYGNRVLRGLAGVEGKVASWCDLRLAAGPDVRSFTGTVAPGFDRERLRVFVEGSATIVPEPGSKNAYTLGVKRFIQPAFGGRCVYEDLTWEAGWKHRFDARWSVNAGVKGYETAFLEIPRDDWIYTGSLGATCTLSKTWTVDASVGHDWGHTEVANCPAREYRRVVSSLGVRRTF